MADWLLLWDITALHPIIDTASLYPEPHQPVLVGDPELKNSSDEQLDGPEKAPS